MERFTTEIESPIGWVTYHSIMRPGEERARSILDELHHSSRMARLRAVKGRMASSLRFFCSVPCNMVES
jgi:hypothetical protein